MYTYNVHKSKAKQFEAKVDRRGLCHLWQGAKSNSRNGNRYGLFNWMGKKMGAHRVAWMRAYGLPIPAGLQVMHKCDTTLCVNPAHLTVGTQSDNMKDMVAKGRGVHQYSAGVAERQTR